MFPRGDNLQPAARDVRRLERMTPSHANAMLDLRVAEVAEA